MAKGTNNNEGLGFNN